MFGMANYLPSAPANEDQESTKQHISWLRSTARVRREEDAPKGKKLMDLTLHDRRRRVILDGERPAAILEDNPWLGKSPSSVFDEIHRISGVNVEKCTTSFLNDYGNAILMACQGHQFHVIDGADRKDKYAASTAAFMGVFHLLKEDPKFFIGSEIPGPAVAPVFIVFEGPVDKFLDCTEFHVYVDGQELVSCGDLIEAVEVYVSCFYIFNLEHPLNLRKTCTFLDKVMLGINPRTGPKSQKDANRKVIAMISKLNGYRA